MLLNSLWFSGRLVKNILHNNYFSLLAQILVFDSILQILVENLFYKHYAQKIHVQFKQQTRSCDFKNLY